MPKRLMSFFRHPVFIVVLAGVFSASLRAQDQGTESVAALTEKPPLITQPVDEAQLTILKGNTHHLARPAFDLGTAPATLPMLRMLLVLKRNPEQESALHKLLDEQQDKKSPNYHKWLKPVEFGHRFGPTDSDMQTIVAWLQAHGFEVGSTKGRTVLEFSGSASQVQEAFHTSIHKYIVNGEQHWANASDPSIPTALTPAVAGILTLHNFLKKPHIHMSKEPVSAKRTGGKNPQLTFSDGTHGLGPFDYATIYNSPAFNGVISGSGVIIGIIGRSNLFNSGEDINDFRTYAFGFNGGFLTTVLNGPDPGDLGGGEEAEATLDSTWAGAVAPGANVAFVVSASTNTTDGVDLSEVYITENDLADVMTESFGTCEAGVTSTDAAGISALAEQAAAQGITYFVSTGDSGAEGCDDPNLETVATGPISVNVLASTAFNVAVGGTVFNEHGQTNTYWTSTNNQNNASARSYIPEDVWNESCLASSCGSNDANIWSGSGGASVYVVPKPSWQSGPTGIPNDGARDLPDVSLTAASHDPYLICLEGSCFPNSQGQFFIYFVWGTSASAPSFAGIMALIDQQMLSTTGTLRQGAANYVLYRLAASENATLSQCNASNTSVLPANTCIFNDVTSGNNAVPGESNYGLPNADYQAGVGYDLATGLGSVNITNLVNQWNTITFNPTTTTLLLNGSTNAVSVSHGTPVNVSISVAPDSGSVIPTGDVSLIATEVSAARIGVPLFSGAGQQVVTLSGGSLAAVTTWLPGSPIYFVTAHYAGDATFAPSDSSPPGIGVTITPEPSTTTLSGPFTQDQNGQYVVPFSTLPFGNPVLLTATVEGSSGQGVPTGTVNFTSGAGTVPTFFSSALNSQGTGSLIGNPNLLSGPRAPFDAGQYGISAAYSGDNSFNPSSSPTPLTFTITPGFFAGFFPAQSFVVISAPGQGANTSMQVTSSTGFKGTISFACSQGLPSEAVCTFTPPTIAANGTFTTTNVSILVSTKAPVATTQPLQQPYLVAQWIVGSALILSFVMIGAPKNRRSSWISLWFVLALIVSVPACGGSSGSHTPPPPPPDPGTPTGSYNVTVTATSGSTVATTGFFLTVQ
jgi:hypothetical protein